MTETSNIADDRQARLRADDLTWQFVDDTVVVLDLRSSQYLELNASGAALFARLADGATADDLATDLVERYGISHGQAAADVQAFLGALRAQGLLEA